MDTIIKQLNQEKSSLELKLKSINAAIIALGGGQSKATVEKPKRAKKKWRGYSPLNAPDGKRLVLFRNTLERKMGKDGYTADEIQKILVTECLLKRGQRVNLTAYLINSGGYYKIDDRYYLKYPNNKAA